MHIAGLLLACLALAQQPSAVTAPAEGPVEFVCPMDPDIRSKIPGKCPRCGMTLVAGIPDVAEYPVDLTLKPPPVRPGQTVELAFVIRDPKTDAPVTHFQVVHEKLFHLFLVSQDLSYFVHDHPVLDPDGVFRYSARLPQPGMYRVLCDFYPEHGTPQLVVKTILVPGDWPAGRLTADPGPKKTENLEVELTTDPPQPIAGQKTLLFFKLKPAEGLESYLGAWAHMLAASDDLIDLMHSHPFLADGGPKLQFNMIFPRARMYRLWVQFQRQGVVNTAVFTIPVSELK